MGMDMRNFDHRYRVRRSLFGSCILQRLVMYGSGEIKWVDVDYDQAPRALITEIDK